jgi:hypothetical protein
MHPFDPVAAIPGAILRDVDASTLHSGKDVLEQWRIDRQHRLLATGTSRWDIIEVNRDGVIQSGHHGARAAAEAGLAVDVLIRDLPRPSQGMILTIRVVPSLFP